MKDKEGENEPVSPIVASTNLKSKHEILQKISINERVDIKAFFLSEIQTGFLNSEHMAYFLSGQQHFMKFQGAIIFWGNTVF